MTNPTPNNKAESYTEIAFILDQSGSMDSIKAGTLEGFNAFLSQQQEEHSKYPVRFTLTLFNTEISEAISSVPVTDVKPLDEKSYLPTGGTALLDAIAITIDSLGKRLAAIAESERPSKVIVAIMTDGEENSSRIFNWTQVSDRIKHQSEVYKWDFLFLGANQDAIATAAKMHIREDNSTTFFQKDSSARSSIRAMSSSISYKKTSPQGAPQKSLTALVAEEELKEGSQK